MNFKYFRKPLQMPSTSFPLFNPTILDRSKQMSPLNKILTHLAIAINFLDKISLKSNKNITKNCSKNNENY